MSLYHILLTVAVFGTGLDAGAPPDCTCSNGNLIKDEYDSCSAQNECNGRLCGMDACVNVFNAREVCFIHVTIPGITTGRICKQVTEEDEWKVVHSDTQFYDLVAILVDISWNPAKDFHMNGIPYIEMGCIDQESCDFAAYKCPGSPVYWQDCEMWKLIGYEHSGVYDIKINAGSDVIDQASCDMVTDGGGWTVFQRRHDGSVDFYRGWAEYENGFGDLNGEFWWGLKRIAELAATGLYELRIDMRKADGETGYIVYNSFSLDASDLYRLTVGTIREKSANLEDSLNENGGSGHAFTTHDSDNDGRSASNCAVANEGAWWYDDCYSANLNGKYTIQGIFKSFVWSSFSGTLESLAFSEMKIRRAATLSR